MARRNTQDGELGGWESFFLLLFGVGFIWLLAKYGVVWALVICVSVVISPFALYYGLRYLASKAKPEQEVVVPQDTPQKKSKGWQQALEGAVASKEDRESLLLYKKSDREFELALLALLDGKPNPPLESRINGKLWEAEQYDRAEIFRSVQILRDSIYHALNSKKPDVARSNFLGVFSTLGDIREKSYAISQDAFNQLVNAAKNAEEQYHTVRYVNQAKGFEEKAAKLKTRKAKLKYWTQAVDVLNEGILNDKSDGVLLEEHIARFKEMMVESSVA